MVLAIVFPAHRISHARMGHQVAFVGAIQEHLAAELPPRLHADPLDAALPLADAALQVEPLLADHGQLRLADQLLKDCSATCGSKRVMAGSFSPR